MEEPLFVPENVEIGTRCVKTLTSSLVANLCIKLNFYFLSLQFHPDGQSYASGGEDGYVRINSFDKAYHDFKFEA